MKELTPEHLDWIRRSFTNPLAPNTPQKEITETFFAGNSIGELQMHPLYAENQYFCACLVEKYELLGRMRPDCRIRKSSQGTTVFEKYTFKGSIGDITGGMLGFVMVGMNKIEKIAEVNHYLKYLNIYFGLLLAHEDFANDELETSGFLSDTEPRGGIFGDLLRQASNMGKKKGTNYKIEYVSLVAEYYKELIDSKEKIVAIKSQTTGDTQRILSEAVNT